jgi:glucose-1-phosphate thymidylyltransferase
MDRLSKTPKPVERHPSTVKAVVPAAGEGTRLRPLTDDRPKGLVEIDGRPLLSYVFDRLVDLDSADVDLEIEEIVVVIGYRGEQIREAYGDAYRGTPLAYVTQAPRCGLADAVFQAADHVDSTFVVLNGDNVFGGDLAEILERHERTGASGTVVVERSSIEAARTTGVVVTDSEDDVKRIVEKPDDPPTTLTTTGCYVLPPALFEVRDRLELSDRGEYELADAIDHLIDAGHQFQAVELDDWRVNVNAPADVERVEHLLGSGGPSPA